MKGTSSEKKMSVVLSPEHVALLAKMDLEMATRGWSPTMAIVLTKIAVMLVFIAYILYALCCAKLRHKKD